MKREREWDIKREKRQNDWERISEIERDNGRVGCKWRKRVEQIEREIERVYQIMIERKSVIDNDRKKECNR